MPIYLYVDVSSDVICALVLCTRGQTECLYFGKTRADECDGIEFSRALNGDESNKAKEMFEKASTSSDFEPIIMRLPYTEKNKDIALEFDSSGNASLLGLSYLPSSA